MSIFREEGFKPEPEENLGYLACSAMLNGNTEWGDASERIKYVVAGARLPGSHFGHWHRVHLDTERGVTTTLAKVILSFTEHPLRSWTDE